MKKLLEKARELLRKGDLLESLKLIKSISDDMGKLVKACPNCNSETVALIKNDILVSECPKCHTFWGNNDIEKKDSNIKELNMKKSEVIDKLWALYKMGDGDITPYDINHFELTGFLKKSLNEKIEKAQYSVVNQSLTTVGKESVGPELVDKKKSVKKEYDGTVAAKQFLAAENTGPHNRMTHVRHNKVKRIHDSMREKGIDTDEASLNFVADHARNMGIKDLTLDEIAYTSDNYDQHKPIYKSDPLSKEQGEALMLSEHKAPEKSEHVSPEKPKKIEDMTDEEKKQWVKDTINAGKPSYNSKIQKSDFDDYSDDREASEHIKEMQGMIDKGHVWHLEGAMGRHAMDLIDAGHVILGPKAVKDFWGNRVPAHHEVKPGTKGSPEYAYEKTGYVHPDHEVSKDGKIGPKKDIKKSEDIEKFNKKDVDSITFHPGSDIKEYQIKDGLHLYPVRHSDSDFNKPSTIERKVSVNHWGHVASKNPLDFKNSDYIDVKKFKIKKSEDMEKSKKSPFEWKAEHAEQYGPGKGAYPFPNLGTDKIKGYKHIQDHFVDKTGMDNDGPALSHASFHAKLTPGKAYAITDEGQFQVHIGEFEREKKIKKSEDMEKDYKGEKEHHDKYEKIAQQIGVDKLKSIVPGTKEEIQTALQSDPNLNNIRLPRWDAQHPAVRRLAGQAGIKSWSLSDTVCTLKHVARHHVAGEPAPEMKKSEDEFIELSKNQMLNMLMEMLKKGEEPKLVSANVITKLDIANELDMTVEKMLYEKAGLEYDSLRKDKGKEWVSRKIRYLMDNEGKTQKQAVGQALGMARQKGLVKSDELTEADLSKVEISGDAPPEAGGPLRRPRSIHDVPGIKKPADKPIGKPMGKPVEKPMVKPEDKKISKPAINVHVPADADVHVHLQPAKKEEPKGLPITPHKDPKSVQAAPGKEIKKDATCKESGGSPIKESMCKGCGMLLKYGAEHVCKSKVEKTETEDKKDDKIKIKVKLSIPKELVNKK